MWSTKIQLVTLNATKNTGKVSTSGHFLLKAHATQEKLN